MTDTKQGMVERVAIRIFDEIERRTFFPNPAPRTWAEAGVADRLGFTLVASAVIDEVVAALSENKRENTP